MQCAPVPVAIPTVSFLLPLTIPVPISVPFSLSVPVPVPITLPIPVSLPAILIITTHVKLHTAGAVLLQSLVCWDATLRCLLWRCSSWQRQQLASAAPSQTKSQQPDRL